MVVLFNINYVIRVFFFLLKFFRLTLVIIFILHDLVLKFFFLLHFSAQDFMQFYAKVFCVCQCDLTNFHHEFR